MIPSQEKSKVSLEEVLRLKRAERPDPEFWAKFERELRQKQLTALVQKRRWWHDVPVLLSRRVYVPAGAAAVVAFTLMTVRYSTPASVAQVQNLAPRAAVADAVVETLPVTVVNLPERARNRHEEPLAPAAEAHSSPAANVALVARGTPDLVGLLPTQGALQETPSAQSIAANLAKLEQSQPELANAVLGSHLTPARVPPAAATEVVPDSATKYRLIARYADHSLSPEPTAPALVRERIARRLGDDITDRISRIGVEGSRVSLKF